MKDRVKKIMAEIFEIAEADIQDDASPESIDNWDSINHMNLIVAIEEEFDVAYSEDEMIELMSLQSILTDLEEKI